MASTPLILLPIDGSDSSLRAAAHGALVAKAFGADVLLLNVQPKMEDWQTHGLGRDACMNHLNERARQVLEDAKRVVSPLGAKAEALVAFGETAETIAAVAEERGCSQVIMGTRGMGELKGLLMGSVGMKLLHLLKVPLTFVH